MQPSSRPGLRPATRLEIVAWVMCDWANSAYSTLLITIVMLYLSAALPGSAGDAAYGYGIGLSTLFAAVLSPVVGALADAHANKRFWLILSSFVGAGAAVAMGIAPLGAAWLIVSLFVLANLAFEISFAVYGGFLPEISTDETVNRISAWGFGAGYIGGGVALILALVIVLAGDRLGLPAKTSVTDDYHAIPQGTFALELAPGRYRVRVISPAEPSAPSGRITANGAPLEPVASQQRQQAVVEGEAVVAAGPAAGGSGEPIPGSTPQPPRLLMEISGGETRIAAVEIQALDAAAVIRLDFGSATPADGFAAVNQAKPADALPAIAPLDAADGAQPALRGGWLPGPQTTVRVHDAIMMPRLRLGVILMGVWWAVFTLPAVFFLHDHCTPPAQRATFGRAVVGAFVQVATTLRNISRYRTLFLFLIGYLLFNDGVQTVISQATKFAERVVQLTATDLIVLVLMIQFVAMPGTLAVAWISDRIGQMRALYLCLAVWVGLLVAAFWVDTRLEFWIMACILPLVMGGVQSVSRAIMGSMTPPSKSGEFFGFFNFSGRATSMIGPPLFTFVLIRTGSAHFAILSLLVFFLGGWACVAMVDVARGQREAQAAG